MAELKFTKQELRQQQIRLSQLERYLPTLQLRKALLQAEVFAARSQSDLLRSSCQQQKDKLYRSAALVTQTSTISLANAATISSIDKGAENIAGVELPFVKEVHFAPFEYDLYDTPPWFDSFINQIRSYCELEIKASIAEERIAILARELKQVYIRVNLFEKVLIPRCIKNIKAIKIFLGDLQLSAVSQAKIAKAKILARKEVEVAQ
jgi:V/A-type H+-transporting ATPase subunit D